MANDARWTGPELLAVGTQVVVTPANDRRPAGAVGVVTAAPVDPTHAYRVRFPDGNTEALKRGDLKVLKQVQRPDGVDSESGETGVDLREFVIYRCIVGSRAYGLDHDGSDVDRRGIYLPPARLQWSITGVPEQLEDKVNDECYWELRKFLVLALKANPNILECLYTPIVEHATVVAQELRGMRTAFLSKLIYQTYNGYVLSQFRRFERSRRTKGAINWKHAMHLVRLLHAGAAALATGEVPVHVGELRDRLLTIRRGEMAWEELEAWRTELHAELDDAYARTTLPDRPDYRRVNDFLDRARRTMVNGEANA